MTQARIPWERITFTTIRLKRPMRGGGTTSERRFLSIVSLLDKTGVDKLGCSPLIRQRLKTYRLSAKCGFGNSRIFNSRKGSNNRGGVIARKPLFFNGPHSRDTYTQPVYVHHEERALVRNFKMTCYYVAPIFARTVARTIRCGTGGRSGTSGQCGIRKSSFVLRF